jgi:hypothetical protein
MAEWIASISNGFESFSDTTSRKYAARTTDEQVSLRTKGRKERLYLMAGRSFSSPMRLGPICRLSSALFATVANPANSHAAQ